MAHTVLRFHYLVRNLQSFHELAPTDSQYRPNIKKKWKKTQPGLIRRCELLSYVLWILSRNMRPISKCCWIMTNHTPRHDCFALFCCFCIVTRLVYQHWNHERWESNINEFCTCRYVANVEYSLGWVLTQSTVSPCDFKNPTKHTAFLKITFKACTHWIKCSDEEQSSPLLAFACLTRQIVLWISKL